MELFSLVRTVTPVCKAKGQLPLWKWEVIGVRLDLSAGPLNKMKNTLTWNETEVLSNMCASRVMGT